jgi:hypothetical protein
MTNKFFIDTADVDYINNTWDKLNSHIDPKSFVGITTNPNALAKINCDNLKKFETVIPKLCELVHKFRGDADGIVYVQVPNSVMNEIDIIKWANYVNQFNGNGAHIGLKLPHFSYILKLTTLPELSRLYLNVTGVSDANTIIKALSYENVTYASIIPGRMEEVGINADAHLAYLASNNFKSHQGIIAGSMRTVEGLRKSIYYGTVPTIGSRVWDIIAAQNLWNQFNLYWNDRYVPSTQTADYTPVISDINVDLSRGFFEQMDILGESIHKEFIARG